MDPVWIACHATGDQYQAGFPPFNEALYSR